MLSHRVWVFVFCGLAVALAGVEGKPARESGARWADPARAGAERVVVLGGRLADLDKVTLTTALAGSGHPGVLLFDSDRSQHYNQAFFEAFRASRVLPVGSFPNGTRDLERRMGARAATPQPWDANPPGGLWKALFPRAERLVVCPDEPRRLLLQAACLAGALRAPLFVTRGKTEDSVNLQTCLESWPIREIVTVGDVAVLAGLPSKVRVKQLTDEGEIAAEYLRCCGRHGTVRALVVANPSDTGAGGGMSALAPWLAVQKNAALVLTNAAGTNVEALVDAAVRNPALKQVDSLLLLGNLQAIPMQRRPNPVAQGKDRYIEMEPLTPAGAEPHTFAVGRLFHEDHNVVTLMLARKRLLTADPAAASRALVVSNPGDSLPLLETLSRTTAREFSNAGYKTTGLFGHNAKREHIRRLLPEQTIFLWEGHYSTLVRDYEIPEWTEPLRPSLIFLQSCLALTEDKALPFLRKGACGVIGTSTRTYSASGGAFALAYFNALVYERQSLGGSLRQAKNFLLAFSLLKEKRLGPAAKLGGATCRSAWAFTLWGDPTLKLPAPGSPETALARVRHAVDGNTIRISLPESAHEKASSGKYESATWANARIGGLLRTKDPENQQLLPLVFAEVHLPAARPGKTPELQSRLPDKNWVFCWDARRATGYLLAAPRNNDTELRFHVRWN